MILSKYYLHARIPRGQYLTIIESTSHRRLAPRHCYINLVCPADFPHWPISLHPRQVLSLVSRVGLICPTRETVVFSAPSLPQV